MRGSGDGRRRARAALALVLVNIVIIVLRIPSGRVRVGVAEAKGSTGAEREEALGIKVRDILVWVLVVVSGVIHRSPANAGLG